MTKAIIAVVVIVILAGGGWALHNRSNNNSTGYNSGNTQQSASNSSNSSNNSSNPPTATGAVQIRNMAFTPSQISVAVGGTVTWTNNDTLTHTVIDDLSNVGGPSSGDIAPGQTYSFKFTKAGSYQYHCSIHPSMRGTIVVK